MQLKLRNSKTKRRTVWDSRIQKMDDTLGIGIVVIGAELLAMSYFKVNELIVWISVFGTFAVCIGIVGRKFYKDLRSVERLIPRPQMPVTTLSEAVSKLDKFYEVKSDEGN